MNEKKTECRQHIVQMLANVGRPSVRIDDILPVWHVHWKANRGSMYARMERVVSFLDHMEDDGLVVCERNTAGMITGVRLGPKAQVVQTEAVEQ